MHRHLAVFLASIGALTVDTSAETATPVTRAAATPQLGTPLRLTPAEVKKHTGAPGEKAAADGPVSGFVVDTSDRFAVLALYHAAYLPSQNFAATHGWTGAVGSCTAGTTSHDLKEDTRRRVNYFRAMAGLPADITFDAAKGAKCQLAALIMAYENGLSHDPDIHFPANPCLTADGIEAAGKSNLSLGSYGPEAVEGQLIDDGSNNAIAGHRRWILYSRATEMATGDVPFDAPFNAANALWVIGGFGAALSPAPVVAWPPAGYVPYHLAPSDRETFPRWSYGYPGANFHGATVTMKRGNTNVPVVKETVVDGAGDNAIVWRPSGIPAAVPDADTTYTVTIDGITGPGPASVSYDVTLVDPFDLGAELTLTGSSTPYAGQANPYAFTPVSSASGYRTLAAPYASGSWTEGAENSPAPQVVDDTDPGYSLRGTAHRASGSYAFHLTVPDFDADDNFVIDRGLIPQAGSHLTFKYRRLFMHPNTMLHVQLSTDDGASFQTLSSLPGVSTGSSADWDPASFLTASVPVPAGYHGRHVKSRFWLEESGTAFTGTGDNLGVYIDEVSMTNHLELTGGAPVTVDASASSFTHTPGAPGQDRLLMAGVELGGRFWGYGPALAVSSIDAPPGPSPTFAAYAASHGIVADPAADPDKDGFPSLLEWALGLSVPSDPTSFPPVVAGTETSGPSTYLTASYLRFTGGNQAAASYTHGPLTYTAAASADAASWPLAPAHTTTAAGLPAAPAGFEWATVRFPDSVESTPAGHVRFTVTTQ